MVDRSGVLDIGRYVRQNRTPSIGMSFVESITIPLIFSIVTPSSRKRRWYFEQRSFELHRGSFTRKCQCHATHVSRWRTSACVRDKRVISQCQWTSTLVHSLLNPLGRTSAGAWSARLPSRLTCLHMILFPLYRRPPISLGVTSASQK